MLEVVKVVKGYEIKRFKGQRRYLLSVSNSDGVGFQEFHSFKSLKEAVKFIEKVL